MEEYVANLTLSVISNKHYQDRRPGSNGLLYAILSCLRWGLLRTIIPRAALIGFKYSQTFLITAAIKYLDTSTEKRDINHAYGLIGAAALIYLGLAVCQKHIHFKYHLLTASL
jgi:ATP-binding cassette, subfamily C (CFTR/MRP), member 1